MKAKYFLVKSKWAKSKWTFPWMDGSLIELNFAIGLLGQFRRKPKD